METAFSMNMRFSNLLWTENLPTFAAWLAARRRGEMVEIIPTLLAVYPTGSSGSPRVGSPDSERRGPLWSAVELSIR